MSPTAQAIRELRQEFGGECKYCGAKHALEFAHLEPTGLSGKGRGQGARVRNIRNNRDSYTLLCRGCHREFDSGVLHIALVMDW